MILCPAPLPDIAAHIQAAVMGDSARKTTHDASHAEIGIPIVGPIRVNFITLRKNATVRSSRRLFPLGFGWQRDGPALLQLTSSLQPLC